MDANEMMAFRGLTPYENFMVTEKVNRRSSGNAVVGLVLGSIGTVLAAGAWIFAPIFANSRAKGLETLVLTNKSNTDATIDRLATLLAAERNERVAQGVTMSQTITDTISGQQQGSQTQATSVENSAMAAATTQLLTNAMLGNLSENAQKVQIYSAPQPCNCPGCGCNG